MAASVFYSYSHKDELYREELENHLSILKRQHYISEWHDRRIAPGDNWEEEINLYLDSADVILLLISSNFLSSDYCYESETIRALERNEKKEAIVVPIIIKPCLWKVSKFAHLQCLPKDGKAITTWANEDEAWLNVAEGILNVIKPISEENELKEVISSSLKKVTKSLTGKTNELEEHLIEFLKAFNRWYFSPLRIVKWGAKQPGFEELGIYENSEIRNALKNLKDEGKVETKTSLKGNPLYKLV